MALSVASPTRTGIDALQQNDVKRRRRENRTQIDGPAVLVSGIDERVIELDVGRGIDGPAEQPLFSEQIAVQVQHTQPSFQHGDEGAQLVVARDQLARLLGGAQRQFVLAGFRRCERNFHRHLLSILAGLDRDGSDGKGTAVGILACQLHGYRLIDITTDPHEAFHGQLVLDEDGVLLRQILHGQIAGLSHISGRTERDGIQRCFQPGQHASRLLYFHPRCKSRLNPVTGQDDPGDSLSQLASYRLVQRRTDIGLLTGGSVGKLDAPLLKTGRMKFVIVSENFDIDVRRELAELLLRFPERVLLGLPAGLSA